MFKYPFYWSNQINDFIREYHQKTETDSAINIVMASDEKFLKYTSVAIQSIVNNYSGNKELKIFLLEDKLITPADKMKIQQILVDKGNLYEIIVNSADYKNLRTTPGISVATYFRLKMDVVLPAVLNKILYLDSDIIVCDDIDKLYSIDLGNNVIGGVEDTISKTYIQKFSQRKNSKHINAGMLLVDLSKLRAMQFQKILSDYILSKKYTLMLGDQEILNGLFENAIKYLPIKWNLHGSIFDSNWRKKNIGVNNTYSEQEVSCALEKPGIIHYTYKRKPWISDEHPKAQLWRELALNNPFFN